MSASLSLNLYRGIVIGLTALAVLAPLSLVAYQSFLTAPFFAPDARLGLDAYAFVINDPDFWAAFGNTLLVASGMTMIAAPIGAAFAFLITRTDLPGGSWLEPVILIPIFVSAVVLAVGYVVALGPAGILTTLAESAVGVVPWNLYSPPSLIVIAGLTHVPYVYLCTAAALRGLSGDLEEAARTAGAGPWRVAVDVSLPMVLPAVLFAGVLVFFLGFELFGLPLVLGDPQNVLLLATYLFKLTHRFGVPPYQLMAVVVVVILAITMPLIFMQRQLLKEAQRSVSGRGKGQRVAPLRLGVWRWPAFAAIALWIVVTVAIPLFGITLRSFVGTWGPGVALSDALTLQHYRNLLADPNLVRGMVNTLGLGVIGGAVATACYAAIALSIHRWHSPWTRVVDAVVMVPRAMPGLVAGLALLWLFLFVKPLTPLLATLLSVWLAYTIVWLAYGTRLVSGALRQVGPELEEAARTMGANDLQVKRDVTVPLMRYGMLASWLLIVVIFVREYSTGVYLLGPGTEMIGSLLVALWGIGAIDLVAALSVVNLVIIGIGLAVAIRLGVRLHG